MMEICWLPWKFHIFQILSIFEIWAKQISWKKKIYLSLGLTICGDQQTKQKCDAGEGNQEK